MQESNQSKGRIVIGLVFISLGLLFFLDNLDVIYFNFFDFIFQWEIFLIIIGLIMLLSSGDNFVGIILILVGALFYASDFYNFSVGSVIKDYWPIILILIGALILFRRDPRHNKSPHNSKLSGDVIDTVSVFSGDEIRVDSKSFKGGKITAIFAGPKINLLYTKLASGTNFLDVVAIFGGIDIYVPKHINIRVKVATIFGGFDDKRFRSPDDIENPDDVLVIKGFVLFGGGDIKSV